MQNEMLKIMTHQILRSVFREVHASTWYSVIADETVDASLVEQVFHVICDRVTKKVN